MIKLNEEGVMKAEICRKLILLHQKVSQIVNFLKEMRNAAPVNTWVIRKWNILIADIEETLVNWIENQTNHNSPLCQSLF